MRKSKIHCGICHALSVSVLLLSTVSLTAAHAQNVQRVILHAEKKADRFEVTTNDGLYLFTPYSSTILETTFIPIGEKQTTSSHAVILQPQKLRTEVKTSASAIDYMAADIVVHIQKSPFQISYTYKNRLLTSEKNGYLNKGNSESVDFNLDDNEALYGAGARALGMNRRGYRLPLYNKAHYGYEEHSEQMNFGIPLVLSSRMYGIHFDNSAIGYLDLDSKKTNVLAYETISGRKTYQIIAGDSWSDVMASYTNLTGHQPLPPRWAFGNFASRFGYHTEAEARDILDKFHSDHIPVDAIIFDLYWFGKDIKGTMGNLAFDKDNFPQPQKMIADFAAQGVKTILITEPFVLTTSGKWQEAVDQHVLATDKDGAPFKYDFYFGNTGLIDIFDPRAQSWFWNIYKNLKAQGVAGWWGDLGEPEVHPSALQHKTGSADQVHNIYGHAWSKLIADGYAKEFPQQRPFILMRAGYSGSQRFGMIPWSGDVGRSWGGLQSQIEIALQMGMQGMGYMHSDLGGFASPVLDDELYARWLQYGVFQPIFRPHAQEEVAPEPVYRSPRAKKLATDAVRLRYALLPYNYTTAFDNSQTGMPLMRPVLFEDSGNESNVDTGSIATTYLWGDSFLVAPVTEAGATRKEVYFPNKGGAWFDFFNGERHRGGILETVDVVAAHIPVFVRAGAFVPMTQVVQSTKDYSTARVDLHYWHDDTVRQSAGKLYDDDGATAGAFEAGKYELARFTSRADAGLLRIGVTTETGKDYAAKPRAYTLHVHNVAAKPRAVAVDGKALDFRWDAKTRVLTARLPAKAALATEIVVSL